MQLKFLNPTSKEFSGKMEESPRDIKPENDVE